MPPASVALGDPLTDRYRTDTRLLTAQRLPIALSLLSALVVAASAIEWLYHPERALPILIGAGTYVVVSIGQIAVVRRRPALSVILAEAILVYVGIGLATYCGLVHSRTEVLLVCLVLLVCGAAVLFPWGMRAQLWASAGVLLGYPLALAVGATPVLPIAYELFGLAAALCVAGLGASMLDQYRLATFQQEAFSAALLDLGRALDAAISDPEALAYQLTEHTRRALAADWAVLYAKDPDETRFRAAALAQVPESLAEEIRAIVFSPATAPGIHRPLQQSGTIAIFKSPAGHTTGPDLLLERWNVSAALVQAVQRGDEIVAVLACCYTAPRVPFRQRERQLIAAIANQAILALENARLMEETQRANRLKSEFVSTVSHEVRTPLTIITGYAELLLDDATTDEQREMLQRIQSQAAQLTDLVQAMLDVNRLEARRLPITLSAFTTGELMNALREKIPPTWCQDGVALRLEMPEQNTVLRSDRGKIEMILRNLIHNALKYTEAGSVTVACEPCVREGRISFTVTDTGPGIAAEEQSAIFDMFRQAGGATRGGGVGLGLYIVKRLTEALGGQISLRSEEGAGTQLTLSLPLEAPQPAAAE